MRTHETTRRSGTIRWAGALLALAGFDTASAQGGAPPAYRYSVEGYLAQYALDDQSNTSKQNVGGFGARLTLNRPTSDSRGILDRAVSSVFVTYTADQGTPEGNTLHVGGQLDASIFPTPVGGVLDPFVSVGVGLFRTSLDLPTGSGGRGRLRRSDLSLIPGIGTRVPFFNGIGARGDLRMPVVFGFRTTANFVAEGGLYVSF